MQVLLPLKEFAAAKQRLAGVLSAPERAQLFEAMVDDVLNALTAHPAIDHVVICSRDRAAVWLARYYEVEFLHENQLHESQLHEGQLCEQQASAYGNDAQCSGLNAVVNAAARRFAAQGATELMVVHGDLPLLTESDISAFVERHRAARGAAVTIAPDRRGSGTNLLAWRALPEFTARYGAQSFQRHSAQAKALQAELSVCDLAGARCDIDEPEDSLLLAQNTQNIALRTMAYLRDSGVAARLALMMQSVDDRNANAQLSGEMYGRAD
jgi:2-phospho-L-lactate guanylyltransferase